MLITYCIGIFICFVIGSTLYYRDPKLLDLSEFKYVEICAGVGIYLILWPIVLMIMLGLILGKLLAKIFSS